MGLFGRQGNPEAELAKALAKRGGTTRVATTQYMNRFTLHGLAPGEPARVMYDREDPRKLLVEGHVRYRTDMVGGEIVVVEVEDVR
jgi:hypothetical protein